jgi:hypothetical protein
MGACDLALHLWTANSRKAVYRMERKEPNAALLTTGSPTGNVDAGGLRMRFIPALGLLAGFLITTPILADETFLTLGLGHSDILRTTSGPHTIIIGNPTIVDANVVADGVIAVTGKATGSTNMILLDDKQAVILQTIVQVGQIGVRSKGIQVLHGDKSQDYSCNPSCIPVATASGGSNRDTTAFGPFRNCDAARAAKASSIRRGEYGYASHLDADDDGIACEPPPLNKRTP